MHNTGKNNISSWATSTRKIKDSVISRPEMFSTGVIESVMMGVPLPSVFVKETNDCKLIPLEKKVLDSLVVFIKDETPLQGMKFLKEYEGKTFSELPPFFQNRIEEAPIVLNIFRPTVSVEEAKEMISLLG